ncbi:MAG: hypothetical protein Q8930_11615 [Bacillota bacterium]|nr:hypothetical protein [Bacillota bacterium]
MSTDYYYNGKKVTSSASSKVNASNAESISTGPNNVIIANYGTAKIDDVIDPESGINDSDKVTAPWNTVKYVTLKLFKYVPVVGNIVATGNDIYNALKAVSTDLNNIDPGYSSTYAQTRYVTRYFHNYISVYDYSNEWIPYGQSLSLYHYKIYDMYFKLNNADSYEFSHKAYTKSNGYGPSGIRQAPHYMQKSAISSIVYEIWLTYGASRTWYESY